MNTRPQIIADPIEMIKLRKSLTSTVGFVPTMGALHQGHASLLEKSRQENKYSILSIFVNPTQFNDPKDFEKYPNTLGADIEIAKKHGVDFIFTPNKLNMYPDQYRYKVTEAEFSKKYCGAHRPGHFDGVLTVVMKLFNVVSPTKAYFGEKDYQQLQLIKDMVSAFFMPCEIVSMPTVREHDGLAMSSRNVRLSPKEREMAPLLYKILKSSPSAAIAIEKLNQAGFKVDYVEDHLDQNNSPLRRLAAVFLGEVRLIDNIELENNK